MASPFTLPKFDNTIGALLVSGLVSAALYGVTSVQTYMYFLGCGNDRRMLKLLIVFLWSACLDTLDSCLTSHMLYYYLVQNYAKPLALAAPVWSAVSHIATASINNFFIRIMFINRVYHLSEKSIILTGGMMALSTLDLTCGIIITAKALGFRSFYELGELSTLMYVTFAAGTSADASVALSLCYYLHSLRTGFQRTDGLVNTLMLYTVNTGLLVAIDATIGMVLYICVPKNFIFIAFYFLLAKLYLNSYLATLNARERLRERSNGAVSIHLSNIASSNRCDMEMGSAPTSAIEKPVGIPRISISFEDTTSVETPPD